jgi:hypothetical protein
MVWTVFTSTPDPFLATPFPPFSSLSFSVRTRILCFLRTKSEARPEGQSLLFKGVESTGLFWGLWEHGLWCEKAPAFSNQKSLAGFEKWD